MSNVDKEAVNQFNKQQQNPQNGQPRPTTQQPNFAATPDPETLLAAGLAQRRQTEFNKKVSAFLVHGYLQSGDSDVNEVLDVIAVELVDTVLLPATLKTIAEIPGAMAQLPALLPKPNRQ